VDKAFSVLFQHCCNGQAFAKIDLLLTRPSAVASTPAKLFLQYTFKLIAVATVSWAHNDVTPTETLTFSIAATCRSATPSRTPTARWRVPSPAV
jgi:type VI protein secretion system component Hcp